MEYNKYVEWMSLVHDTFVIFGFHRVNVFLGDDVFSEIRRFGVYDGADGKGVEIEGVHCGAAVLVSSQVKTSPAHVTIQIFRVRWLIARDSMMRDSMRACELKFEWTRVLKMPQ